MGLRRRKEGEEGGRRENSRQEGKFGKHLRTEARAEGGRQERAMGTINFAVL